MNREEATKMKALEHFMEKIAEMVGCLPSYSDPHPNRGNAHIVKQLRLLTSQSSGREETDNIWTDAEKARR